MFSQRLGLPHYYAHVVLGDSVAAAQFADVLLKNASIGPQVRSLVIAYWKPSINMRATAANTALLAILSRTTGLVRLTPSSRSEGMIPWDAFEVIAESSALHEFSVQIACADEVRSTTVFKSFSALRNMEWSCGAKFLLGNIPEDGLRNLEHLEISFASPSFLMVLRQMKYDDPSF